MASANTGSAGTLGFVDSTLVPGTAIRLGAPVELFTGSFADVGIIRGS